MVSKPAPQVRISAELLNFLNSLNPDSRFRKWIEDMNTVLKGNMFAGESVPKKQIPAHYLSKHGVNNLIAMPILKATDPAIPSSKSRMWAYAPRY